MKYLLLALGLLACQQVWGAPAPDGFNQAIEDFQDNDCGDDCIDIDVNVEFSANVPGAPAPPPPSDTVPKSGKDRKKRSHKSFDGLGIDDCVDNCITIDLDMSIDADLPGGPPPPQGTAPQPKDGYPKPDSPSRKKRGVAPDPFQAAVDSRDGGCEGDLCDINLSLEIGLGFPDLGTIPPPPPPGPEPKSGKEK